jgi:hypothetical protein
MILLLGVESQTGFGSPLHFLLVHASSVGSFYAPQGSLAFPDMFAAGAVTRIGSSCLINWRLQIGQGLVITYVMILPLAQSGLYPSDTTMLFSTHANATRQHAD